MEFETVPVPEVVFETELGGVKIIQSKSGGQLVVWLPGQVHPCRFNSISSTTPDRIGKWLMDNGVEFSKELDALIADVEDYCERYRNERFSVLDDSTAEWPPEYNYPVTIPSGTDRVCDLLRAAKILLDEATRLMTES